MGLGKTIREFGVKLSLAYDKGGFEQANKSISTMAGTLKEIGFGAAAAAGTIFGFAEAAASNAKDLQLYSSTLGISAERLQELAYGAKIAANVNREDLMGALEGVSKTLDDVKRGNLEAGATFTGLGINVGAMVKSGMRADQVMAVVADRLKEIQDPIARTALATKVFGGNVGARLLPYLLKGSAGMAAMGIEARKLGVIMDDKTLKSQARFQDSLNRVLFVLKNISYLIGGELIKKLEPLVKQFQKWIVENRKLIATGIVEFVKALGWGLKEAFTIAVAIGEAFKSFGEQVGGTANAFKILIGLWAVFKGAQMIASIYSLATAFGTMGASLATMMPELLLLSGVVVALHDGWKLLRGGDIKETWVYQMVEYIRSLGKEMPMVQKFVDLMDRMKVNNISEYGTGKNATPNSVMYGGLGGGPNAGGAKNEFNTQVIVQVPPGTSPSQATGYVADGVHEGLNQHLRSTRNANAGGVAY